MITRLSELKLQDIRGVIFDLDGTLAHSNPDFAGLRRELGIHSGTDILAHVESLSTGEARAKALDIVHEYERQVHSRPVGLMARGSLSNAYGPSHCPWLF